MALNIQKNDGIRTRSSIGRDCSSRCATTAEKNLFNCLRFQLYFQQKHFYCRWGLNRWQWLLVALTTLYLVILWLKIASKNYEIAIRNIPKLMYTPSKHTYTYPNNTLTYNLYTNKRTQVYQSYTHKNILWRQRVIEQGRNALMNVQSQSVADTYYLN